MSAPGRSQARILAARNAECDPLSALPAASAFASVARAFGDPVDGAQRTFRALLEAMARPGRLQQLAPAVVSGLQAPGLSPACAAALLCLVDAEATLWIVPGLASEALCAWLRFHTGVRLVASPEHADFALAATEKADATLLSALRIGSDESPQGGATLIVDLAALVADPAGPALRLTGPGVRDVHRLAVDGLPVGFWTARDRAVADFPCGIDLVFACGDTLAAVPRSTRIDTTEA